MNFKELCKKSRSCRRYDEQVSISREQILDWIDTARYTPASRNAQAIRYMVSSKPETNALIFPHLVWAGYLRDWDGPEEGERPGAYIIMLADTNQLSAWQTDAGIVAQTILLAATEAGFGGCMIGSLRREPLRELLHIAPQYDIALVLALGKPTEHIVIEEIAAGDDIKYHRDENQVHYVPKIRLSDLILG